MYASGKGAVVALSQCALTMGNEDSGVSIIPCPGDAAHAGLLHHSDMGFDAPGHGEKVIVEKRCAWLEQRCYAAIARGNGVHLAKVMDGDGGHDHVERPAHAPAPLRIGEISQDER